MFDGEFAGNVMASKTNGTGESGPEPCFLTALIAGHGHTEAR